VNGCGISFFILAFLNWALKGYTHLEKAGRFEEPEASIQALNEYRRATDHTIDFIDEALYVNDSDEGSPLRLIFNQYQTWCLDNGLKPLGRYRFNNALEKGTGRSPGRVPNAGLKYLPGVFIL
jgi:putative DNA primase/helicase